MTQITSCKICEADMRMAFRHQILRKYEVSYFFCDQCGHLRTEEPYWLDEAYSNAIAVADTGVLQRNTYLANVTSVALWKLFGARGKYLDAAGGYGIFTRLMRDKGFDYYWSDPHSPNLLARGFEGSLDDQSYLAVSAFEVLEHVSDPVAFLSGLLRSASAKTLVISTELFTDGPPDPESWWYYTFETGQHISFYRRSTLELIAVRLGLRLYSANNVHIWTNEPMSQGLLKLITQYSVSGALGWVLRRRMTSKTWIDHETLLRS